MSGLDRNHVLKLLNQLDHSEDHEVLTAARALVQYIQDLGLDWETLLPNLPDDDYPFDHDDITNVDAEENFASDIKTLDQSQAAEEAKRIETILKNHNLNEDTKEDLHALLDMIKEGNFSIMDQHYVQALDARLKKPARRGG